MTVSPDVVLDGGNMSTRNSDGGKMPEACAIDTISTPTSSACRMPSILLELPVYLDRNSYQCACIFYIRTTNQSINQSIHSRLTKIQNLENKGTSFTHAMYTVQ